MRGFAAPQLQVPLWRDVARADTKLIVVLTKSTAFDSSGRCAIKPSSALIQIGGTCADVSIQDVVVQTLTFANSDPRLCPNLDVRDGLDLGHAENDTTREATNMGTFFNKCVAALNQDSRADLSAVQLRITLPKNVLFVAACTAIEGNPTSSLSDVLFLEDEHGEEAEDEYVEKPARSQKLRDLDAASMEHALEFESEFPFLCATILPFKGVNLRDVERWVVL